MSKTSKGRTIKCYCGGRIRPGDKRCGRCHRVTKAGFNAGLRKAVAAQPGPAFVAKSASPATRTVPCVSHVTRPGGSCCTRCGATMLVPPMNKSAFAAGFWQRELGNSPDPELRELVQKMLYEGGW